MKEIEEKPCQQAAYICIGAQELQLSLHRNAALVQALKCCAYEPVNLAGDVRIVLDRIRQVALSATFCPESLRSSSDPRLEALITSLWD